MRLTTPTKVHGGKHYLATKIVELLPPHRNYVEPYFGGGSVLFAKDPTDTSEVVNDIDGELTNFWRVLQGDDTFAAFKRVIDAVPFSEKEFDGAGDDEDLIEDYPVESAVNFFIRCRQSLAGRRKSFTPISTSRLRRGRNEQVSAWLTAVEGLPAVHERLRRVVILNRDALDVIRDFDKPDTVIYADPPYVAETRSSPNVYRHEMTGEQHRELLKTLKLLSHAKVALSSYDCDLYRGELDDWRRVEFDVPNNAAGGERKRRMVECVWMNY